MILLGCSDQEREERVQGYGCDVILCIYEIKALWILLYLCLQKGENRRKIIDEGERKGRNGREEWYYVEERLWGGQACIGVM